MKRYDVTFDVSWCGHIGVVAENKHQAEQIARQRVESGEAGIPKPFQPGDCHIYPGPIYVKIRRETIEIREDE